MDLNDVFGNLADQDRGLWRDILHPVTGLETGIRMLICGPDSSQAHAATIKLADRLAEMADVDGVVSAADREKARREALAARVLAWEVTEDGKPVPFTTKALIRVLHVGWIEAQVDGFAADRRPFFEEA